MNGCAQGEEIHQWGPYFFVEWSFTNVRNKSMMSLMFGRMVAHKRKYEWKRSIHFLSNGCLHLNKINQRVHYFLVEWSWIKERINKRGPYILSFRSWCCLRKRGREVWRRFNLFGFGVTQGNVNLRFPWVNPVLESFPSDIRWAITNYCAEAYLESCRTSTKELFWENNQRL